MNEVWDRDYIRKKKNDDISLHKQVLMRERGEDPGEWVSEVEQISSIKTGYIVIGPLSNDLQIATGE